MTRAREAPCQTCKQQRSRRKANVSRPANGGERDVASLRERAGPAGRREGRASASRRCRARPAGWRERASQWDLEGPDYTFLDVTKYLWNPLMDYWFRMEIEGWENIPPAPALLIGIHSGAPFVWDAWTVGVQWWRHFGRARPLHGTAHDALMATPAGRRLLPPDGRPARPRRQHHLRAGRRPGRRAVAGRRARLAAALDPARRGGAGRAHGLHPPGHPQPGPDRAHRDRRRPGLDARAGQRAGAWPGRCSSTGSPS